MRQSIYFLGIKGVAMANLAIIAKELGYNVYGVDTSETFITDSILKEKNISYDQEFKKAQLPDHINTFVYSAAHGGINNPLSIAAKERGLEIISQPVFINRIMKEYKTKVAVCGCHGKTTTTSLLAYALTKLGENPAYLIGTSTFANNLPGGSAGGSNNYFVIEADEYGVNPPIDKTPKFLLLNPDYIICTNIDFDHPDVYESIEDTKVAFQSFFKDRKLLLNIDDPNIKSVLPSLKRSQYTTYGTDERADFQILNIRTVNFESVFDLHFKGKNIGTFSINLHGIKNIGNTASVLAYLYLHGYAVGDIQKSIQGFVGAKRRFEKKAEIGSNLIYDDYAHHPHEIEATIQAFRSAYGKRRLVVIFQPHTFSRTLALLPQFIHALSQADLVYMAPVFASARETVNIEIDYSLLIRSEIEKQHHTHVHLCDSQKTIIHRLQNSIQDNDIIVTMGAGDVYKLYHDIIGIVPSTTRAVFPSDHDAKKNVDLFPYLSMRLHVNASHFVEPKTKQELVHVLQKCHTYKYPYIILGGGSNIVFTSDIQNKIIIKNSITEYKVDKEQNDQILLTVSSGCPMSLIVSKTISNGWEGFEYHKGLPGVVGGAVYMNSKWTKPLSFVGDCLISAEIYTLSGEIKTVKQDYFQFAYDYSRMQKTKDVLLEATFLLKKNDPSVLKARAQDTYSYRQKTQPFGIATCGCFFQNITEEEKNKHKLATKSAGYLIDNAGLKGFSINGFSVSLMHANFIVNNDLKKGNPKDLLELIQVVKSTVKKKFGIELREEVAIF